MVSKLVIVPAENVQERVDNFMKGFEGSTGVYVSLNKTQKSLQKHFDDKAIEASKVFFIDCVTKDQESEDVLHLPPTDLEGLEYSVKKFFESIKGQSFLVIDALSTLLIYNTEKKVAAFVKSLVEVASERITLIAITPETKGEELLKKIYNFFDEVDRK